MQLILRSIALFCLTTIALPAWSEVCDVDADQDIDRLDIRLIAAARNQPATGPEYLRDANGDGVITVVDARACVNQCTLARCAIVTPDGDLIWYEGNWDEEDWQGASRK